MNTDDKINRLELRIHRLEQEAAYRLRRLERTLGTLISWPPHELGEAAQRSLLDMLNAPEDPTPADKSRRMFGAPDTDSIAASCDCNTKTPDIAFHKPGCRYRLICERDQARSLVAAFEKEVNAGFNRTVESEKQHADAAISDVNYIFRLNKELRERVEKVIGHWRDTDWFREGGIDMEITVGVNEAEAIKLLKYLKP